MFVKVVRKIGFVRRTQSTMNVHEGVFVVLLLFGAYVQDSSNAATQKRKALGKTEPRKRNATQVQIDKYRRDFIFQLLNGVQFKFPSFKLSNADDDEDELNALDDSTVMYYLYTRQHPHQSIIINKDQRLVDPKYPVKLLVHGWTEHYYVQWCKNLTAAYLRKGNYNVIVLDWSKKGDADYVSASMAVKPVSDMIGDFIVDKIVKGRKVPLSRIHLISHSLGCHVAGLTGQRVVERAGRKLARITALDPASPIFEIFTFSNSDRLSPDDANFVDIVHTDSGVLGFRKSIGTADFHPNGGIAIQPGCSLMRPDVTYDDLFCSHARSHKIFLRSVLIPDMVAVPCDTWEHFAAGNCDKNPTIVFGDDSPTNVSGNYFLRTPEEPITMSLS